MIHAENVYAMMVICLYTEEGKLRCIMRERNRGIKKKQNQKHCG